jgi:hypothetical protein
MVRDDQDANGSRAMTESLFQLRPEIALINNLETLLDFPSLGHGNEPAIVTNVNQTVLLEDRAEEGVEDHRGRRVRDNTRFLVKLLSEKVNTKIPVLTGLSTGGDTNNLARTVLQDHEITNTDVVTGDGKGALRLGMSRRDVRRRRVVEVMMVRLIVGGTVVGSRIKVGVAGG